jgi:hypothetical protein
MEKRRFVICYDGTWNAPDKGAEPTNVVKMVRAVLDRDRKGVSQVVFYDKGVGTAGGTDALVGGGLGVGLTANVLDGYRFLGNNHADGDEIYIFGFSRGAYTARSLAGLLGFAGLLSPDDLGGGLRDLMEIYQRKDIERDQKHALIDQLPIDKPRPVGIDCVGVWDTVGSLGIPGDLGNTFLGGKFYFHDVELGAKVDVALHAIAVDEKRSAFSPTLWVSRTGKPVRAGQKVEQVWFAGAHSNVGGSYEDTGLSDLAFQWMVQRVAKLTKLELDPMAAKGAGPRNAAARGIDSRTFLYKGSVLYPYQRIINREIPEGSGLGEWFRRNVPRYDRRNIPPDGLLTVNERLHVSLLARWELDRVPHDCKDADDGQRVPYRPVNLAAVMAAAAEGRTMPVVGWDGELMDPAAVEWPDPDE